MTTTDDIATDPVFADATSCAQAVRDRAVSSRELLDALLDRVDRLDGATNAVVTLDAERARDRADEADRVTAAGGSWGPLHGVPMTVKDVWETAGLRTTSGAPELADHVPDEDAVSVARLRAAGAVIFGKTNTPLYAGDVQTFNELFGTTGNPWDPARTPGGSSGGSAAAVAAGLTPLELGSDIGGSIRMPSHLCGTFGLKPSWPVVPSRGHIPGGLAETDVNQGGPMARSVRDLALGLDVLAGPIPEDAPAWRLDLPAPDAPVAVDGLRIDLVVDDADFPVSAEVRDLLRAGADRLADAGAQVVERPLPVPLTELFASWQRLVLPIIGTGLPDATYEEFAALAAQLGGDDRASLAVRSLTSTYRAHDAADQLRQHHRARWAERFDSTDLVVMPALQVPAFPHDTERTMPERTIDVDGRPISHLDLTAWCGGIGTLLLPVAVVPFGRTGTGLPVGAQLVGPYLRDRSVLAAAEAITSVLGGFVAPPGY